MLKRREGGQRSKLDQPSSCQPCTISTESYTAVVLPLSRESKYREAPWRKTHLFWGRDDMGAKKVIPLSAAGKGKISVETISRNSSGCFKMLIIRERVRCVHLTSDLSEVLFQVWFLSWKVFSAKSFLSRFQANTAE